MTWKSLLNQHIQFKDAILDCEVGFEPGMRAVVKSIRDEGDNVIAVGFDFTNYEEFNKQLMSPDYFDRAGNARHKWCETKFYPENKIEDVYLDSQVPAEKTVTILPSTDTVQEQIAAILPIAEQMNLDKVVALLKGGKQGAPGAIVLFLDIDGVLNGHKAFSNGYNGTLKDCVDKLNFILKMFPELKIVVSSAWRYILHGKEMTLKGFEYVFCTHGVTMIDRLHGCTEADEATMDRLKITLDESLRVRREQIQRYVADHAISFFVVVDDLDLGMPELVRTNPNIGLDVETSAEIRNRFQKHFRQKMIDKKSEA